MSPNQSFQFVPALTGLHRTAFPPLRCAKAAAEFWRYVAVHEGIRMPKNLTEAKDKLLSTEYPRWRNFLSCAILVLVVTGAVSAWWYVYYTTPDTECHKGFLYFSVIWLAVQWVVIGYLYRYQNIPAFARDAIKLQIFLGNIWFGLFGNHTNIVPMGMNTLQHTHTETACTMHCDRIAM